MLRDFFLIGRSHPSCPGGAIAVRSGRIPQIPSTSPDHTLVVDDLSADDCQDRLCLADVIFWNRQNVAIEYSQIRVIPDFYRAEVVFPDEPFIRCGRKTKNFRPRQRLISENGLAGKIFSG